MFSPELPRGLTVPEEAWPTVFVDTAGADLLGVAVRQEVGECLHEALSRVHQGTVTGQALLKVHIGEPTCRTRMRPEFARASVEFLRERGSSGVAAGDTTVAYTGPRGHRQNLPPGAETYLRLARQHGWSPDGPAGVPFVVLDRPGTGIPGEFEFKDEEVWHEVEGIQRFSSFCLAGGFAAADFVVSNAHLTLHGLAGVAGCAKSIAMGCSSLTGKLTMHQSMLPVFDGEKCAGCGSCAEHCPEEALLVEKKGSVPAVARPRCIGCGECVAFCTKGAIQLEGEEITDWGRGEGTLCARMTDYTVGLMQGEWDSTIHVLHMYDVTGLCDCVDFEQEPLLERSLGFLVGKNPFAIDKLAADILARAAEEEGRSILRSSLESADRAARYARETYGILAETPVEMLKVTQLERSTH
jgi:uncharacterized Fe-S center protein